MKTIRGKFSITSYPVKLDSSLIQRKPYDIDTDKDYYNLDRNELKEKVLKSGIYTPEQIKTIESIGCRKVVGNILCVSPFSSYRYNVSILFSKEILKAVKAITVAFAADSAEFLVPENNKKQNRIYKRLIERSPNVFYRPVKDRYPLGFLQVMSKRLYDFKENDYYFPGKEGILIVPLEKLLRLYMQIKKTNRYRRKPLAIISDDEKIMIWGNDNTKTSKVLTNSFGDSLKNRIVIKGDPLWGSLIQDYENENLDDCCILFVVDKTELFFDRCISCGRCIEICPVKIKYPYSMNTLDINREITCFDNISCVGCGLCSYFCPAWKR
ncbi:MAG: indolepyruvate ferredoxin oxidoreductase subunit alpha [Elusimicrobiota bacterium]